MITQQIKRLFCSLTAAELKIATYVLESPQEVTGLTVHQLAEKCGVASGEPVFLWLGRAQVPGADGGDHCQLLRLRSGH